MKATTICCTAIIALLLTGCGGGGSGAPIATPTPGSETVDSVFGADPTGRPTPVTDPAGLADSIDGAFGEATDAPVTVNPGDTITDVLSRARNG